MYAMPDFAGDARHCCGLPAPPSARTGTDPRYFSSMIARFTTPSPACPASAAAWIKALLAQKALHFRRREGAERGYFRFSLQPQSSSPCGPGQSCGRRRLPHRLAWKTASAANPRTACSVFVAPEMNWAALRAMFIIPASCSTSSLSTSSASVGIDLDVGLQGPGEELLRHRLFDQRPLRLDPAAAPRKLTLQIGNDAAVGSGDEADQTRRASHSRA